MVVLDGTQIKEPAKMNEPCVVAECAEGVGDSATYTAMPSILEKKDDTSFVGTAETNDGLPPQAKEEGLITLSNLPPAHWKNLFHLELVKERNKPTEAPKKPPQAPFFLQWRDGLEKSGGTAEDTAVITDEAKLEGMASTGKESTDGWDAVWSDDDDAGDVTKNNDGDKDIQESSKEGQDKPSTTTPKKRRKVVHHRSKLAGLLQTCFDNAQDSMMSDGEMMGSEAMDYYSDVTSYLSKMGPSSIDVEISSLCYGIHDLEEGLPLLHLASKWLLEACGSRTSFEAVNAYLHRFLHVHGDVITRMDLVLDKDEAEPPKQLDIEGQAEEADAQKLKLKEFIGTVAQLRLKQREASDRLQGKMQHSLCLLRHLSRMV